MPRKLRVESEGGLYHVINRGNYRAHIFETDGAKFAFENALRETLEGYGWRIHAYVIMSNHYHLAVETPQPNLVDGAHNLQSSFATRFNRLRKERGHVFQGRYQSLIVEDTAALTRLVDYIHLNSVRAGIETLETLGSYPGEVYRASARASDCADKPVSA
ncbi:MAG: transposase [Verrucomicrobia bacterium]|nr:transposase [Verrucomicrobiota bacterium]